MSVAAVSPVSPAQATAKSTTPQQRWGTFRGTDLPRVPRERQLERRALRRCFRRAAWTVLAAVRWHKLIIAPLLPSEETMLLDFYNRSGGLNSFVKIRAALSTLGQDMTDSDLEALLQSLLYEEGYMLSYQQFRRIFELKKKLSIASLRSDNTTDAFVALGGTEKTLQGTVDAGRLRDATTSMGLTIDIDALIRSVDEDGSGALSFDEFSHMFNHKGQEQADCWWGQYDDDNWWGNLAAWMQRSPMQKAKVASANASQTTGVLPEVILGLTVAQRLLLSGGGSGRLQTQPSVAASPRRGSRKFGEDSQEHSSSMISPSPQPSWVGGPLPSSSALLSDALPMAPSISGATLKRGGSAAANNFLAAPLQAGASPASVSPLATPLPHSTAAAAALHAEDYSSNRLPQPTIGTPPFRELPLRPQTAAPTTTTKAARWNEFLGRVDAAVGKRRVASAAPTRRTGPREFDSTFRAADQRDCFSEPFAPSPFWRDAHPSPAKSVGLHAVNGASEERPPFVVPVCVAPPRRLHRKSVGSPPTSTKRTAAALGPLRPMTASVSLQHRIPLAEAALVPSISQNLARWTQGGRRADHR